MAASCGTYAYRRTTPRDRRGRELFLALGVRERIAEANRLRLLAQLRQQLVEARAGRAELLAASRVGGTTCEVRIERCLEVARMVGAKRQLGRHHAVEHNACAVRSGYRRRYSSATRVP